MNTRDFIPPTLFVTFWCQKVIQQNLDQGNIFNTCTGCYTEYSIVENQDNNLISASMNDSIFMKNIILDIKTGEFKQTIMDQRESGLIMIERGYCTTTNLTN